MLLVNKIRIQDIFPKKNVRLGIHVLDTYRLQTYYIGIYMEIFIHPHIQVRRIIFIKFAQGQNVGNRPCFAFFALKTSRIKQASSMIKLSLKYC